MLDRYGFKRKNYADLLTDMDVKARELFGDDINTSERSPLGILIRLFAWFLAKTWELAEKVYNSGFITKAEGVQLDYLTPFFNTKRNPERASIVLLAFTGTPAHTIVEGTQFTTESNIYFVITEDVTLDVDGTGEGQAVAMEPGITGNVLPNTITVQAEPDADVLTVTNPEAATGGRDKESDGELLSRLLDSTAAQGSATADAIRAAVTSVPRVRAASVIENNSDRVVNGNEPKSIHVYVLGGEVADVAQAIYSKKAAGIATNGVEQTIIQDASGNDQTIKFDYATEVNIYASIALTTNAAFPADGVAQVQNAIVKVIGGLATDGTEYAGLGMGEEVYLSQLIAAVHSIAGVVNATIEIGEAPETLSPSNITIDPQEVAQTAFNQIEVTT